MEKKLFSETVFRIFPSDYLLQKFGKGFSVTNLKQMRQFYLTYANDTISQTVSDPFEHLPTVSTGRKFFLSWPHYLKLMRIDNVDERHFYEIESVKNDWSLSELKRQYDSSLYERLALSTDKDKVYRLALEGQNQRRCKRPVCIGISGVERTAGIFGKRAGEPDYRPFAAISFGVGNRLCFYWSSGALHV